jgi:hypothetical protein
VGPIADTKKEMQKMPTHNQSNACGAMISVMGGLGHGRCACSACRLWPRSAAAHNRREQNRLTAAPDNGAWCT